MCYPVNANIRPIRLEEELDYQQQLFELAHIIIALALVATVFIFTKNWNT